VALGSAVMPEELRLVPRSASVPSPTLRDVAAVFFRQRRLWTLSFAVILVGAVCYGVFAPAYRSEMKVLVRRGRTNASATPTLRQAPQFDGKGVSEEDLNSEVELLRDRDVLAQVVRTAGLAAGTSWSPTGGDDDAARIDRAVERLQKRISVEPVRKTNLIAAGYTSSDPEMSARVLRCLADAYLQHHVQVRRPSGESEFFQRQVEQARKDLEQKQFQLMEFTRDQGVVSAAAERDSALQKLSEAEAAYRETRVALAETAERIITLQGKLQGLPERRTTQIRNLDNPQLLEKIKSRLLELQLKRTELLTKYEPTYRLVQEVDQQIAEAKAALVVEDQTPLRDETTEQDSNHEWAKAELLKAQVEFKALQSRAQAMSKQLFSSREAARRLGDRAIAQDELLRGMKTAEDNYLLYVNKREEARIGDALEQDRILDVSIAEEPRVPALPVRSVWSFGVIGLALAGTVSTGLAFASDYLDPAFRTPDEVLAYLGTPVLASLPQREN
jgi:protein tyrosine kinase modulator